VPIVGLYGPTLPERSAPWRDGAIPAISLDAGPLPCRPCDQRICAPGDFRCLTTISAGRVLEAAERLLQEPRRGNGDAGATDRD
jgi:ADP-heptose:LPS heptosyltransferase